MLKFVATGKDGRTILGIGLSFANLDKFRREPGETFIKIKGSDIGLPVDIFLFSGETESDCASLIDGLIGPDTKVNIDPKLKQ